MPSPTSQTLYTVTVDEARSTLAATTGTPTSIHLHLTDLPAEHARALLGLLLDRPGGYLPTHSEKIHLAVAGGIRSIAIATA